MLAKMHSIAESLNLGVCVLTFQNHPLEILRPDIAIQRLTSAGQKREILGQNGVDTLIFPLFTNELAQLSAESFIEIFTQIVPVHTFVVGSDVTFGANRRGNLDLLTKLGSTFGFRVEVMEPVLQDAVRISSSIVRALLQTAELDAIEKLLGRPYSIHAQVSAGSGMAREMRCPTLNISLEGIAYPREGIYAASVCLNQKSIWYPACVYIGLAQTLQHRDRPLLEAHILDVELTEEVRDIQVEFHQFLRADKIFESKDALLRQIEIDVQMAKQGNRYGK